MSETFKVVLTVINILVMGGTGVAFLNNKADAAKFDPAPLVQQINNDRIRNAEVEATQNGNIGTMKRDIQEIKDNVKELKDNLDTYFGWNKPATLPTNPSINAPLVKGVKIDGSPLNANGTSKNGK